jgi:hypothetical protein
MERIGQEKRMVLKLLMRKQNLSEQRVAPLAATGCLT